MKDIFTKDIYSNPTLYYILVPIIVALWPLFVWGVYLPNAERSLNRDRDEYNKTRDIMAEILKLDPDRLEFADPNRRAVEFDYAVAIEKVASSCGIPPTNYRLSSGIIITSGGRKSQSANVVLKDVDITRIARFLWTIQLRWASLQCVRLKLTQKKGLPDKWDADMDFKYYY